MASDPACTAWIEVGPGAPDGNGFVSNGSYTPLSMVAMRQTASGTLTHTNHYISDDLARQNTRIGPSSAARLTRIQALLAEPAKAFTLEDFNRMSRDQSAGPDDSIFRIGRTPLSPRTLATFAVRTPATGAPVLEVSGFDVPSAPWHVRVVLDHAFWQRIPPGAMLRLAPATP